ncbi:hypothetical protein ACJRO7_020619 [Eucalyptus globulus]|uniref:Secreted protein n=1 Tax=Eucalyptus globulus TaxID=34317 RepID=A0ABD3KHE3_EUCGL
MACLRLVRLSAWSIPCDNALIVTRIRSASTSSPIPKLQQHDTTKSLRGAAFSGIAWLEYRTHASNRKLMGSTHKKTFDHLSHPSRRRLNPIKP